MSAVQASKAVSIAGSSMVVNMVADCECDSQESLARESGFLRA